MCPNSNRSQVFLSLNKDLVSTFHWCSGVRRTGACSACGQIDCTAGRAFRGRFDCCAGHGSVGERLQVLPESTSRPSPSHRPFLSRVLDIQLRVLSGAQCCRNLCRRCRPNPTRSALGRPRESGPESPRRAIPGDSAAASGVGVASRDPKS